MVQPTYPGVYVQELPSGVRTISGVATSVTAFVGYTARGLDNRATRLFSYADYERSFGGLAADSELSYSVQHFFANGGGEAIVVRVPKADAVAAAITARDVDDKLAVRFTALSKGEWGNAVTVDVAHVAADASGKTFDLTITDQRTGVVEAFSGVTMDSSLSNYVVAVINDPDSGSRLVSVAIPDATAKAPAQTGILGGNIDLADLANDKSYQLKVSADIPSGVISALNVEIIAVGEPLPTSVGGVARLVERKLTAAVRALLPGASIRAVANSTGKGLRLLRRVPRLARRPRRQAHLRRRRRQQHPQHAQARRRHHQRLALRPRPGPRPPRPDQPHPRQGRHQPPRQRRPRRQRVRVHRPLRPREGGCSTSSPSPTPPAPRRAGNPLTLASGLNPTAIYSAALTYCQRRRAFLLVDPPPEVNTPAAAADWKSSGLGVIGKNAAAYFPACACPIRSTIPAAHLRPLRRHRRPLCAHRRQARRLEGARRHRGRPSRRPGPRRQAHRRRERRPQPARRSTACAPSRSTATSAGARARSTAPTASPASGSTSRSGASRCSSRRASSAARKWVVFEPNDEPLWAQIRLNVGAFMHDLFRQGAFQGTTPRDAYFVKCDGETTTQDDINLGIVNIHVGFAPLKPAEFVVIKIQQIAGRSGLSPNAPRARPG